MSDTDAQRGATQSGLTLALLALLASLALGAKAFFAAPWFVWVLGLVFLGFAALASLGLADRASRGFLSGTLKHRNYTQIYRTLVARTHRRVWDAYCDADLPDNASLLATFRGALTWKLYDKALLLAVAYPIVLPVLWWLASGQAAQLGTLVFLEATDGVWDVWPERAAFVGALAILTAGLVGQTLASASSRRSWRRAADWLLFFAVAGAVALAVAVALAGAVALALAVGVAAAGAVGLAGPAAVPVAFAVDWLDNSGRPRLARWLVTLSAFLAWLLAATFAPWEEANDIWRSVFIFLGVFPLLNALFDVVSYAVTLSLIRRGLRAPLPVLYGVADLGVALLLFLGLGVTLVAVVSLLNAIAGTDILDVSALLQDVEANPHAYWWLYAMVFSTILPTVLHALLALLGIQGIWPLRIRRPVAAWVAEADRTQLANLRAALALGLLWAVPVWALIALGWGAWHLAGDIALWLAERYLDVLQAIAARLAPPAPA